MRWFRRHPILTLLVLFFLAGAIFLVWDSGCLSKRIPSGKAGIDLMPGDAPYAIYIPDLTPNIVKSFQATASFGKREFTKKAGVSYRERVLLSPGIETSVEPHIYPLLESIMYLCGTEITFVTIPDPARPPGELGFVACGKLRLKLTPRIGAHALYSKFIPGTSWSRDGELSVASIKGKPNLWMWIGSGWCIIGDNKEFVLSALERATVGTSSLAANPHFKSVLEQQHNPPGFVFYTGMKSADRFLSSTGKPGNMQFAKETERYVTAVRAASWGWFPDYDQGIGKDLNIYDVEPATMSWLKQRYPKIDQRTAALTNEKTAIYAPFSVPLAALEEGNFPEMPRVGPVAREWLIALGHTSAAPLFDNEGAFLVDIIDDGPGIFTVAFSLKNPSILAEKLKGLAAPGTALPEGTETIGLQGNVYEIAGSGLKLYAGIKDNFLLVSTAERAITWFATKPAGQSILERPYLKPLVRTALECNGDLVGGYVYDSQMVILNWQKRAEPHWEDFIPLLKSIEVPVEGKPAFLKPDEILSGGAFYAFLKDSSIEARHHMDKSMLGLVVPISTIPIAVNLFYGQSFENRRKEFYALVDTDKDGFLQYFVDDFLDSDSVFIPTFAAHVGMMYYPALMALGYAALSPAQPDR